MNAQKSLVIYITLMSIQLTDLISPSLQMMTHKLLSTTEFEEHLHATPVFHHAHNGWADGAIVLAVTLYHH